MIIMNYDQFKNLSCYEEFEMQCTLTGISKINVLKEIGHVIDNYYFFISKDGIFNWFDSKGNHVEDPNVLKEIKEYHIPKDITKCIIPNSITSIGRWAFSYCDSLKEVTIPNNIVKIYDSVFYICKSLTSVIIPDNIESIGNSAFYKCKSLKEITLPNSVESISNYAFYRCESLTSITIPKSMTYIGVDAFYDCDSLKEIVFKGKTLKQVKRMENFPFGIEDESKIKCEGNIRKHRKISPTTAQRAKIIIR